LSVNLNINNENQDCKIGTVCVYVWGILAEGERVKEGGDGIWLMDFIYLYETELRNLSQLLWVVWDGG
jgi:hypothetical protein